MLPPEMKIESIEKGSHHRLLAEMYHWSGQKIGVYNALPSEGLGSLQDLMCCDFEEWPWMKVWERHCRENPEDAKASCTEAIVDCTVEKPKEGHASDRKRSIGF